jgi:syringate O-demethylase
MFHAQASKLRVTCTFDERTVARPDPQNRRHYRYQLQGPNAAKVIEAATNRPAPELKFFHMCWMTIAGKKVHALRHGMAGQPGYELMGPWADGPAVHSALVAAERRMAFSAGGRPMLLLEHAGIGMDSLTAPGRILATKCAPIASGSRSIITRLRPDRRKLCSNQVEDYYFSPWDRGYGPFVKFDHHSSVARLCKRWPLDRTVRKSPLHSMMSP